ncbi:hypothetical protein, partial [Frankia sp. AvcI1]
MVAAQPGHELGNVGVWTFAFDGQP